MFVTVVVVCLHYYWGEIDICFLISSLYSLHCVFF